LTRADARVMNPYGFRRFTESGTHAELVAQGGSYARMHRIQSAESGGIV